MLDTKRRLNYFPAALSHIQEGKKLPLMPER